MEAGFVIIIKIKKPSESERLVLGPFGHTVKEAFEKLKQDYGQLVPKLTVMVFQAIGYPDGKISYFPQPQTVDEENK